MCQAEQERRKQQGWTPAYARFEKVLQDASKKYFFGNCDQQKGEDNSTRQRQGFRQKGVVVDKLERGAQANAEGQKVQPLPQSDQKCGPSRNK